jgi:hypothetical protein
MGVVETILIYAIVGLVVATALILREEVPGPFWGVLRFAGAFVFWPLFAPSLLATSSPVATSPRRLSGFEARIAEAEGQLRAALGKLQGAGHGALAPEVARVRTLWGALVAMSTRLGEMDEMLETPEFDAHRARRVLQDLETRGHGQEDLRVQSVQARLRNIERLRDMRARAGEDLERALLKIEEMSSQILLLAFAGRPEAEVADLIRDIAQTVDDITEGLLAVQ